MDRRPLPARSSAMGLAVGAAMTLVPLEARGGALDVLAKEAANLGPVVGPAVVVAAPLTSDEPGSTDDLAVHFGALVAAQLGADVTASRRTADLATAQATARDAKTLVFVHTWIARGDVRMTAEVYSAVRNVWDRVRSPAQMPSHRAAAAERIDAQVRAFLTPLTIERARVQRFRLDNEEVLAAACGDADADGREQLLLVSRRRVTLGRVLDGAFAVERTAAWSDLAPRAPIPLREPLGGAVAGNGTILVGSTDYGGVALSPDLSKRDRLAGIPVWGGRVPSCLVAQPSAGAFDGAPIDCVPSRDPKPVTSVPAPRFDAFAATDVVDSKGHERTLVAVREPSGRLKLRLGDESGGLQGPFGAQIAVGDLDQDGFPELVTTTDDGGHDSIDVLTIVTGSAAPQNRLHLPTPDQVRALAVCPPGENGAPALAAIVGGEVWLVRADLATKGSP